MVELCCTIYAYLRCSGVPSPKEGWHTPVYRHLQPGGKVDFTPSTPQCAVSGNPAPNSHLGTTPHGIAAPLPGSTAPRLPPPSSPRTSSGTRESSSPVRAHPLPAPSAGQRATLPALPVH